MAMRPYKWCSLSALAFLFAGSLAIIIASFGIRKTIRADLQTEVLNATLWTYESHNATVERFRSNLRPEESPQQVNIYFFNLTNVAEVRAGGKPHLREVGPYMYRSWWRRYDVDLRIHGAVSFREAAWLTAGAEGPGAAPRGATRTRWPWFAAPPDPALTLPDDAPPGARLADGDLVTTLNLPLLGVLRTIAEARARGDDADAVERAEEDVQRHLAREARRGTVEGLFMHRTVRELLFGYDDALIQRVGRHLRAYDGRGARVTIVPDVTPPAPRPGAAPRTTMNTMRHTGTQFGAPNWTFNQWRGRRSIECWPHDESVLGASDGTQFYPGVSQRDALRVFVPELFRSVTLRSDGMVRVHGASLLQFAMTREDLAPGPRYGTQVRGLLNVSRCATVGAGGLTGDAPPPASPPLFVSLPHFCRADAALAEGLDGVRCDAERHSSWLGVDPLTGITMAARKRLQVVSEFDGRHGDIDGALAPTKLPIFWSEELAQAGPADVREVRGARESRRTLGRFASAWFFALCGMAALAAATGIVLLLACDWRRRRACQRAPSLPEAAMSTRTSVSPKLDALPTPHSAKSGCSPRLGAPPDAAALGGASPAAGGGPAPQTNPAAAFASAMTNVSGAETPAAESPNATPGAAWRRASSGAAPSGMTSAPSLPSVRTRSGDSPAAAWAVAAPLLTPTRARAAAAKAVSHFTGRERAHPHTPPDTPSAGYALSNNSTWSAVVPQSSNSTMSVEREGLWPGGGLAAGPGAASQRARRAAAAADRGTPRHAPTWSSLFDSWGQRSLQRRGGGFGSSAARSGGVASSDGGASTSAVLPPSRPAAAAAGSTGHTMATASVPLPPSRAAAAGGHTSCTQASGGVSDSMPLPPSRPAAAGAIGRTSITDASAAIAARLAGAHTGQLSDAASCMTASVPLPPSRPAAWTRRQRSGSVSGAVPSALLPPSWPAETRGAGDSSDVSAVRLPARRTSRTGDGGCVQGLVAAERERRPSRYVPPDSRPPVGGQPMVPGYDFETADGVQ